MSANSLSGFAARGARWTTPRQQNQESDHWGAAHRQPGACWPSFMGLGALQW